MVFKIDFKYICTNFGPLIRINSGSVHGNSVPKFYENNNEQRYYTLSILFLISYLLILLI